MVEFLLGTSFIELGIGDALQVALLGFIGGVLSGFIGSGGAFFMTPGMMNLGVPGTIAVATNITHKFGKAMVGSHKHGEAGNVDKKLTIFVLGSAIVGIQLAVFINSLLFKGGTGHGASKGAGANLNVIGLKDDTAVVSPILIERGNKVLNVQSGVPERV